MKKIFWVFILLLYVLACKEIYNAPIQTPSTGYLVVEGYINNGADPTVITLTRTTRLYDTVLIIYEHSAQVSIESDGGESYPLAEQSNGNYVSGSLTLNAAEKYRIHIRTTDGKEYLSDFSDVRNTPAVDSITWKVDNKGVRLYANSHDPGNSTRYYEWKYSETWEFHSSFVKRLDFDYDPLTGSILGVHRLDPPDYSIYRCWKTQLSTDIIIGSTEKLNNDTVYLPVRYIEPQSFELSVLYYMKLKQYALSHDAYLFKQKLKKNTEQLGSIFDAQPSELSGNIHCTTDPSEIVIGFVEVSQEQLKTIFIHNSELDHWPTVLDCSEEVFANKPFGIPLGIIPTRVDKTGPFNSIITFFASDPICVDCTLRGTNVKPPFWP